MPVAALFWLAALLLAGATVAALVWPLLRARAQAVEPEDVATTDVYRDQKRQLDAEWAAGAITREERDASLDELAARLGAELDAPTATILSHASRRLSHAAAVIVAALLPITAVGLYAAFGNPGAMQMAKRDRAPMTQEQIVAMVETLAARMKEHPEDPTGWRLLARSYAAMGRYAESVAAFTEAAARSPEDPSLLADWADALAMQQQSLQGEPSRLIARALTLDPMHQKALLLSASAALDRKDYDAAIAQWRKVRERFPAGSEAANELDAMMAEAASAKQDASGVAPAQRDATARALPAGPSISGQVSLDPKLKARVAANDALFIFARAIEGPRMPLAVVRATAGELPKRFTLDDSMAMTPAARLSSAQQVVIEARISKSGNATAAPGDLQGRSAPLKPGASGVTIVIDDVVH